MGMKKVILFLVTFLGVLLFVKLFYSYPTILTSLQFDAQNLIVWKYAAQIGLLPYRDVFYPYGILSYYVNVSPYFTLLYSLVFLLLLMVLLFVLNKTFDKTHYALASFVLVLYNVLFVTGVISFSRYGVTVIGSLLFAAMLYKYGRGKFVFLFGCVSGLSLGLITDQGIALITVITSMFVLHSLLGLKKRKNKNWLQTQFKTYLLYILGCFVGILPFVVCFLSLGIFDDFVLQFLRASDISIFAKTPYFHALREVNELGNFIMLYVSIAYLTYILLFKRKSLNVRFYVVFALTISLFLFEQKSIIRFVGHQIDFIALLLFLTLVYDLFSKQLKKVNLLFSLAASFSLLFLIVYFVINPISEFTDTKLLVIDQPSGINTYQNVIDTISQQENYKGKIFSLPGDPIFYVVNKQPPSYYFTNYEASPRYAQERTIDYIKRNNIQYVVFNTAIASIQDGVPDYMRTPYLYSYVFKNYSPVLKVNNFIVLKKGSGVFESREKSTSDIANYFLVTDLGNIARSEGKYKAKYLSFDPETIIKSSSQDVQMSSYSKVLLVYYKTNAAKETSLRIISNKQVATVTFNSCNTTSPCMINMSNIPLFYAPKIIEKIEFNAKDIKKIEVYTQKQRNELW